MTKHDWKFVENYSRSAGQTTFYVCSICDLKLGTNGCLPQSKWDEELDEGSDRRRYLCDERVIRGVLSQ